MSRFHRFFHTSYFIFLTSYFILLASQFSHARTVIFPVHGLEVATPKPVQIEGEWDEKWFWETPTTAYNHNIARIAAFFSEISYVEVEKSPESNPLLESYRALGFKDGDIEWNYVLDYTTAITGNNQAAYSFANKTIQTPSGAKKLIFVILRGTPLSANEWISNVNVSDTTHKDTLVHEGFFKTVQNIHTALIYYLLKNKISPEESIFLITGHSRGAALANLLGATLEDEGVITGERLFVYTFAAPNVSQEEKTGDPRYNFIWNIVNGEDIVPTVPPNRNGWHWKKFGHTKVIVNYWNARQKVYLDDYLPRMNVYFRQLLLRDYAPFKNGPFLHIQLSRVLTSLYKNVEKYYGSVFALRNMAENILWKVFPGEDAAAQSEKMLSGENEKMPALLRMIQRNVNSNIEGGFEYAMDAFVDMHACETYLSWLLALDEGELYSDLGSTELVINGNYDCAVYDDDGNLLCKIMNGAFELYSLKVPVAGLPLPTKNVIGFPRNQNLSVVIHKDSLIPTMIGYKIEHYSADGTFLRESEKQHLFPNKGHVIYFKAGEETLWKETVHSEKLSRAESKPIIKKYALKQNIKFKIQGESSYSTEKIWEFGFRTGTQAIYASFLGDIFTHRGIDAYGISLGIGHQTFLYGPVMLDVEAFSRFLKIDTKEASKKWNFVPAGRLSLSYKPRHRLQFFAAGVFDLYIEGFNDDAFGSSVRRKTLPKISLPQNAALYPSIQFGIRL